MPLLQHITSAEEERSSITNLPGPESSTTFSELVTFNESASESISTQQLLPRSGICNEPDMWSDVASSNTSVFHSNSPSPSSAPTYSEFTTNSSGYTTNESDDDDLADNAAASNDINLTIFTMYKLVGDNLDKNVSPREMTYDHQTQSHHYFQTYTVSEELC